MILKIYMITLLLGNIVYHNSCFSYLATYTHYRDKKIVEGIPLFIFLFFITWYIKLLHDFVFLFAQDMLLAL